MACDLDSGRIKKYSFSKLDKNGYSANWSKFFKLCKKKSHVTLAIERPPTYNKANGICLSCNSITGIEKSFYWGLMRTSLIMKINLVTICKMPKLNNVIWDGILLFVRFVKIITV